MATYAIGDLQGCYDAFCRLLDKIGFQEGKDKLWLTGDLVNRGPKSLKTIRLVRSLGDSAVTVLGNHDLHLLSLAYDVRFSDDKFDSMWKILGAPDGDELVDWLRCRPLAHYSKKRKTILVHAGIPPQWSIEKTLKCAAEVEQALQGRKHVKFLKRMYGNKPNIWSDELTGYPRLRFIVNALTRMRMIRDDGRLNLTHKGPPEPARKGLIPWYAAKDTAWHGTRIVFGHWSALGLRIDPDIIAVDTGCVWGRQLTAVRLNSRTEVLAVDCDDS